MTVNNYDRLVLESNDIWIIEVYEDGDPYCEHVADSWEAIVNQFNKFVKFGRVNAVKQAALLPRLPFKAVVKPTVFSIVKGYEPEIFPLTDEFLSSLKAFVEDSIHNEVELINLDEAIKISNGEYESDLSVLLIVSGLKTHHLWRANSIKYRGYLKFYQIQARDYQKVFSSLIQLMKHLNRKVDYILLPPKVLKMKPLFFNHNKKISDSKVNVILKTAKSFNIFKAHRKSFAEFCQGHTEDTGLESTQPLCILIPQGNQKALELSNEYIHSIAQDLADKALKGETITDSFTSIQFLTVSFDEHPRFKSFIEIYHEKSENSKPDDMKHLNSIAILSGNKKMLNNYVLMNLEDFYADLMSNNPPEFEYVSGILENRELSELFRGEGESDFILLFNEFYSQIMNGRNMLGSLVVMLSMIYGFKKTFVIITIYFRIIRPGLLLFCI